MVPGAATVVRGRRHLDAWPADGVATGTWNLRHAGMQGTGGPVGTRSRRPGSECGSLPGAALSSRSSAGAVVRRARELWGHRWLHALRRSEQWWLQHLGARRRRRRGAGGWDPDAAGRAPSAALTGCGCPGTWPWASSCESPDGRRAPGCSTARCPSHRGRTEAALPRCGLRVDPPRLGGGTGWAVRCSGTCGCATYRAAPGGRDGWTTTAVRRRNCCCTATDGGAV